MIRRPPRSTLFPTRRSPDLLDGDSEWARVIARRTRASIVRVGFGEQNDWRAGPVSTTETGVSFRSEEHTSELQSQSNLVCRLLLEKKKKKNITEKNVHT